MDWFFGIFNQHYAPCSVLVRLVRSSFISSTFQKLKNKAKHKTLGEVTKGHRHLAQVSSNSPSNNVSDLTSSLFVFVLLSCLSHLVLFSSHFVSVFFTHKSVGASGTTDLTWLESADFHNSLSPRESAGLTMVHDDANLFDASLFFPQCKLGIAFDVLPRGLFSGSTETRIILEKLVQCFFVFFLIHAGFLGRRQKAAAPTLTQVLGLFVKSSTCC